MKTKLVRPVLVKIKDQDHYPILGINAFDEKKELFLIEGNKDNSLDFYYYQLIFISLEDEKIEVGDKYLDDCGLIREAVTNDKDYWNRRPEYYKIIAIQEQIPESYIQQFIEEYNRSKRDVFVFVRDVEIEMEEHVPNKVFFGLSTVNEYDEPPTEYKIKLNNGFVTIVEKESNIDSFDRGFTAGADSVRNLIESVTYTEEEVLDLLIEFAEDCQDDEDLICYDKGVDGRILFNDLEEWFEQNKKK